VLDDPLSAVDPQVAEAIFEKCIKEFLKLYNIDISLLESYYISDTLNGFSNDGKFLGFKYNGDFVSDRIFS
jgi:hypothetical protein